MPTLTPIDIYGNFRSGYADGRGDLAERLANGGRPRQAADIVRRYDPAAAAAYEARDRRDAGEAYGRMVSSGNYQKAEALAGERGDMEGLSAIRQLRQQHSREQRVNTWRVLRGYRDDLAAIDSMPEAERQNAWTQLLGRARQEAAQSPEGDASWLEQLPAQWSPQLSGNLQTRIDRIFEEMLDPEDLAELESTNRRLDIQERGADTAERRAVAAERTAEAAMLRAERGGGGQEFSRANSLRDEYNQQTAGYRTIADFAARSESYFQRANAGHPSGQGDVGLVYALAKIYDPTSVVREGEFAMVARQGGYGEQMRSWVETASGRGFSPQIRAQIMQEIRNGVRSAQQQRDQVRTRYEGLARRANIDPALVIDDYQPSGAPPAGGGAAAPPRPPNVPADYVWNAADQSWDPPN